MIQFFTPEIIRDENETRAFNVFKALVEPLTESLSEYYENVYNSPELGEIIYKNSVSPITSVLNDPRIKVLYPYWHDLYINLQNADGIIKFIEVLYKVATVEIKIRAPENITINVNVDEEVDVWWNRDSKYNLPMNGYDPERPDDRDYQLFLKDSDEDEPTTGIVFITIPIPVSSDALAKVLRDVMYPGLFYDVNVIK